MIVRVAALIQHSNVAQTLELDEQNGTLYVVMEWVDGEPLSNVIESAEQGGRRAAVGCGEPDWSDAARPASGARAL